jgi:hypothetical protein
MTLLWNFRHLFFGIWRAINKASKVFTRLSLVEKGTGIIRKITPRDL